MGLLSAKIDNEDDGSSRLSVTVRFEDFSGTGAAYLDTKAFLSSAEAFSAYPLPEDKRPEISGGFYRDDGSLEDTHLLLCARPLGSLGRIALRIELAWPRDRESSMLSGRIDCEVEVTYEKLSELSRGLVALGKNHVRELEIYL